MTATPPPTPYANPEYRLDILERGQHEVSTQLDTLTLELSHQIDATIGAQTALYQSAMAVFTLMVALAGFVGWLNIKKMIASSIDAQVGAKVTDKIRLIESDFTTLRQTQMDQHDEMMEEMHAQQRTMDARMEAILLFQQGNFCVSQKKYDEAIACYNQAIAMHPTREAYSNRGYARAETKDLTGALADYDAALAADPTDPRTYYNRGTVRFKLQDFSGALSDYDEAISRKPDYARAHYNKARSLAALHAPAGEVAAPLHQAISLLPSLRKEAASEPVFRSYLQEAEVQKILPV